MTIYYIKTTYGHGEAMEPEKKDNANLAAFMKLGIVILSIIAIVGYGINVIPNAVTVSNHGSKRDLPIYCVSTDENKVALSFDCAWGNDYTEELLKLLDEHDVTATFFMTGDWVDEFPDYVKEIARAGHDIGNHSENHMYMTQLSQEQCLDEIMKVHEKVKELTGVEMNLFRPPYGDYDNILIRTAKDNGYYTIQWDVDSLDWKDYGVDSIVKGVMANKNLGNGSIIRMHNGARYTVEALEYVIDELQEKGYEIVPVSELIYKGQYMVDQTGRQFEK
jgi:polysaccharide deacetylase family sporulation protein PdaB